MKRREWIRRRKSKQFFRITPSASDTIYLFSPDYVPDHAFQLPSGYDHDGRRPNGATQVMVVERIYTYGFKYFKMGYASAYSWLLFIIIFILTGVQMKRRKDGCIMNHKLGGLSALPDILPACGDRDGSLLWMLSTSLKSKGALMEIPIRWIPENPTMDALPEGAFSKFPFQGYFQQLLHHHKLYAHYHFVGLHGGVCLLPKSGFPERTAC